MSEKSATRVSYYLVAKRRFGRGKWSLSGKVRSEGNGREFFIEILLDMILRWCPPDSGWCDHSVSVQMSGGE